LTRDLDPKSLVGRLYPEEASAARLVVAAAIEIREGWETQRIESTWRGGRSEPLVNRESTEATLHDRRRTSYVPEAYAEAFRK